MIPALAPADKGKPIIFLGLGEYNVEKLKEGLPIVVETGEMEESIDPMTDDPELLEARWVEFDEWAEQRYQEILGPQLVEEIFGHGDPVTE